MIFDQSRNTMTQEKLNEVVQQHELWRRSGKKDGKQADLSEQILVGLKLSGTNFLEANLRRADLRGANLRKINLQNTNLRGTNFQGANLQRADLRGANLQGANFRNADLQEAFCGDTIKYARNWRLANGLELPVDNLIADLEQQILQQSQEISKLQEKLAQAADASEENESWQQELEWLKQEKADTEAELEEIKKDAKIKLSNEIKKARVALSEIFQEGMQKQIDEHQESARCCGWFGLLLIAVDFVLVIGFVLSHWWQRSVSVASDASEISSASAASAASGVSAVSSGGQAWDWSFAIYSFPILVIFVLATTLLRHQKKLLDEVRHFSAAKHQVELYSGLLKASQHAAAHLNDPSKSAEYVQETFGKIRDKLLQYQFAVPADGKDGDAGGAADKLVDKIIEKAVSGGKGGS